MSKSQTPKRLSTLIGELTELLRTHGDGYIEDWDDLDEPYAFWVENDKQYYIDSMTAKEPTNDNKA